MNGQWMGKYAGSSTGIVIVNFDERRTHYHGVAYLLEENPALPSIMARITTENKDRNFTFRTNDIAPLDPRTGLPVLWDSVKQFYSADVAMSKYADVTGSWDDTSLTLNWTTDIGATGNCVLPRSKAGQPSELVARDLRSEDYKTFVAGLEGRRFLFRGQTKPWRLRTSFHRAGRADLTRFLFEDVQALHKHLSARTRHVFNLEIPNENGAFFNLVQHHGYPTPLLDWTYSPYVAAFFAYRGISNEEATTVSGSAKVRVLVFDQAQWKADWSQALQLLTAGPHFSIGEFLAIENERMIPQQAASTVTNLDDIETYIRSKETSGKVYLSAIDLPLRDRRTVVRELGYMGITAGSMFPGLDGACEELRERNFDI
jgi:FRG domain-containing protein